MKKIFKVFLLSLFFIIPSKVFAVEVSNYEELLEALNDGGEITLTDNIDVSDNIFIEKDSVIDLNGQTINLIGKSLIPVADVTVKDTSNNGTGKIKADPSGTGIAIQVGTSTEDGKFTLKSGTIDGTNGVAIYVVSSEAVIDGGLVTSNSYATYNLGRLIVNDGEVSTPSYAIINKGYFELNGGLVYSSGSFGLYGFNNAKFEVNGGTVKIEGNNLNAVHLSGNNEFVMNNGNIISTNGYGIVGFDNSTVEVNGGKVNTSSFSLSGNGSANGSGVKFTIKGGEFTSENSAAMYLPQIDGETNISGGKFVGESAIEIRSGELNITGGEFTSVETEFDTVANGNGSTTRGCALAISQHTTMQEIDVELNGGKYTGIYAVCEVNPQNNSEENISKITLDIKDGNFITTNGSIVYSTDFDKFISGGVYNKVPLVSYIKNGYTAYNIGSNEYKVDEKSTLTAEDKIVIKKGDTVSNIMTIAGCANDYSSVTVADEDIISYSNNKITGLKVGKTTLNINLNDLDNTSKEIEIIVYDVEKTEEITPVVDSISDIVEKIYNDEEITSISEETKENIKDAIEAGETISAKIKVEAKEEISNDSKEKANTLLVSDEEILAEFDISYILMASNTELGSVSELSNEVTVSLDLPTSIPKLKDGYEREFYIIRIHDGKAEKISAKLVGNKVTFKSSKFSSYILTYKDSVKSNNTTSNPQTGDNILVYIIVSLLSSFILVNRIRKKKFE